MMTNATPYYDRPISEIALEAECMRFIFCSAAAVDEVWEAFGGIGATARVLHERFPRAYLRACDLDAQCVACYNALGAELFPLTAECEFAGMECFQVDAAEGLSAYQPKGRWGASLDFNRLTLLDLRGRSAGKWKIDLIQKTIDKTPEWIQITDSAVGHLHLNWQTSYGLPNKLLSTYIATFAQEIHRRWSFDLLAHANHARASYLLFGRTP